MTRIDRLLALTLLAAPIGCEARSAPIVAEGSAFAPAAPRPRPTYEADVAPMIDRYCSRCHSPSTARGGVVLDGDPSDLETWARVADVLRDGTMPPIGHQPPTPAERSDLRRWLDLEVFGGSSPEPGRATMRRLDRAEYDNTIRDLIGLDLPLAADFPADDVAYGFDNIGDVLAIPPVLTERYLGAADRAIEAASRDPRAWSRLIHPSPDLIPLALRKPTFEARSEPVKRIGRPSTPPPVDDPEVLALRKARDILRGFADRAFRRPATAEELGRLVALVESARKDGDTFDEAIRFALKAVLVSPHFLFLVEEEPTSGSSLVGEFELASRLSYFLWSSLPDDELYRLAARGELRRGGNLAGQVRRMLGDDRSRALVDGFVVQWLQLRTLKDATPDPSTFPDFDEPLRRAMLEETSRFARSVLAEGRDLATFLDADFTFVDARLARHYGLPGVVGDHFRRVSLAGTDRRGILTQASVLTLTSNPTRTSPVKRGKWVLDNLLGMPPPPPPSGVEGLKDSGDSGHFASLKQRMERHRDDPGCASCHSRMDPIGFGLEGFDAIGARRAVEAGGPVDDSGRLPGGESFRGPSGLVAVLAERREAFARCVAEKLMIYALGRGVGPGDRCALDEVVRKAKAGGGTFSSLALAIVESVPFQGRGRSKEGP